ncbi:GNAT family N-acetyltransferase [Streptomyces sp. NPDC003996]
MLPCSCSGPLPAPRAEPAARDAVLVEAGTGTVMGCPPATYIPGLGKGGAERALIEAVLIRADRRGGGLGRRLMERALARARAQGCASSTTTRTSG